LVWHGDRDTTVVDGTVVDGTMMVEVVDVVVVGGAALEPPHAAKTDPINTSVPRTNRYVTPFISTT
jgi:hypothetical protein